MKYLREDLRIEYERYAKEYTDIPELSSPFINISDVLRAYFILADYFTDTSANVAVEQMLIGVRSMDLLISALGRQSASFGGVTKYNEPLEICATLFFGLVKNHAFSDGNKRTALLTLLYQLDCYGYYPKAAAKEFEKLVVAIAANELEKNYHKQWKAVEPRYKTDANNNTDQCVRVIYRLLKKMTQKKDNSYHIDMTARDLIDAINSIPLCSAEVDGTKIKLSRRINRKAFGFLPWTNKTELNYSIPFGGYTRTIGAGTARDVLNNLDLYDQYPDYASFASGSDPRYMLIQQFEGPLRRLKDK